MTICAVWRLLVVRLLEQVLVALIARLGFRLPRARRGCDPLLLAGERALVRRLLAAFLLQPLLLLHQPGRVVALVGDAAAAVELEDPAGDVVEEVAVVGDDQDRARIVAQVAFEPRHRLGVEMVGRLVEQQQLRLVEQQLAQRHAAALAARELRHVRVVRRTAQRVHRLVDLAVEIPQALGLDLVLQFRHLVGGLVGIVRRQLVVAVEDRLLLGDAFHDVFANRLRRVQLRFLLEVADAGALGDPGLAVIVLVEAGHDLQQRGFARAVDAQHADLGVRIEGEVDVIEHLPVARIGLRQALHEIDELTRHSGSSGFGLLGDVRGMCRSFSGGTGKGQGAKGKAVAFRRQRQEFVKVTRKTPRVYSIQ